MWKVFSIFCLSLTISTFSEGHENCGTLVRSICSDKTTTKWNSKSVGGSLRKWIESVSKIIVLVLGIERVISMAGMAGDIFGTMKHYNFKRVPS